VSTSGAGRQAGMPKRPRLSVTQLLAAKHAQPIQSLDDRSCILAGERAPHHPELPDKQQGRYWRPSRRVWRSLTCHGSDVLRACLCLAGRLSRRTEAMWAR